MRSAAALMVIPLLAAGCSLMMPGKPNGSDTSVDTDTDDTGTDIDMPDTSTSDTADDPFEDPIEDTAEDDGEAISCTPLEYYCDGNTYMQCHSDGESASVVADCADLCVEGTGCVVSESCEMAALLHEYSGCQFVAVPLPVDSDIDGTDLEFGLLITNPNSSSNASVNISSAIHTEPSLNIPAGSSHQLTLPLPSEWQGLANDDWTSFASPDAAYSVSSNVPIRVAQYNPWNPLASTPTTESAGASLLLPAHALTANYVVATLPPLSMDRVGLGTKVKRASYIAILGMQEGTTNVTVTLGGHMAGGGGLSPESAGATFNVMVGHFSTLYLASGVPDDCNAGNPTRTSVAHTGSEDYVCIEDDFDLSGTRLQADKPIAVFTGSTAALVPVDIWDMDHLEEQIPPAETLSGSYVIAPLGIPGALTPNIVKIVGTHDSTSIVTTPSVAGVDAETVHVGEVLTATVDSGFALEADHPLLVMQFDDGRYFSGATPKPRGDPAMTIVPNTYQWTSLYSMFVPGPWSGGVEATTYVQVIRENDSPVFVDYVEMAPVDGWHDIATYQAGIFALDSGQHQIQGDTAIGLITVGHGEAMAWAHPTGMYLSEIGPVVW